MLLKVCNMLPDGFHRTCSWMACLLVTDGLVFNSIFLHCKQKSGKINNHTVVGVRSYCMIRGTDDIELDVFESEGFVDGLGATLAVFYRL